MRAAVHDVVPGGFAAADFGGETVYDEIADQPRRVVGRVQAVVFGAGGDAGGHHQRHGADDAVGEDGYGFSADIVLQPNVYAVWKLFDFDRGNVAGSGRVETPLRLFGQVGQGLQAAEAAQGLGEVGQPFRPGEDGVGMVAARAEIVQPRKGGYFGDACAVVVAAAVVEIPEQFGGAVVLTLQPSGESQCVEPPPFFILRGEVYRDGEDFAPVAAVGGFQTAREGEEAFAVGILRGEMVAPAALVQQPFLRSVNQIGFVEAAVCHDAQIVQHFADVNAFFRRQGEVVRAGRGGEVLAAVGGVVAVAFEAFGQQNVAPTVFGQIPQRAQTGRAAAQNQDVAAVFGFCLRRQGIVAQGMAERQADAVYMDGRQGIEAAPQLP